MSGYRPTPYYDYDLQVWIVDGVVRGCGHRDDLRRDRAHCCDAHRWAGLTPVQVRGILRWDGHR